MESREQETKDTLAPHVPVHKQGRVTGRLCFAVFSAVLGMFQFGYQITVINAPEQVLQQFYNQSYIQRYGQPISPTLLKFLWSLTVAIFAAGGIIGVVTSVRWSEKLGRKRGILANAIFGLLAGILMFLAHFAWSFEMVIIGRFLAGWNCGLYTALVPVYNSELASSNIRGAVGLLNQLAVTVGLTLAQFLSLEWVLGSATLWPYLFGFAVIPPVLHLLLLPFCPESPRYLLLTKKDEHQAIRALKKLRGCDDVTDEVREMYEEQESLKTVQKIHALKLCKYASLRLPLGVAIVMHFSQQLSGIMCILFYSTKLFGSVGLSLENAQLATVAVGGIMFVMTLLTIPLVDRLGRKALHLTGLAGMFICSILFTTFFSMAASTRSFEVPSIAMAMLIVFFFALGPGSIPWMIVPEFFSQGPRQAAVSVAVFFNWLSIFVVGLTFPYQLEALHDLVLIPYIVLLLFFFIFLSCLMPETKGKSFEEVALTFNRLAQKIGCNLRETESSSAEILFSRTDSQDSEI